MHLHSAPVALAWALGLAVLACAAHAQAPSGVPQMKPPLAAPARSADPAAGKATAVRTITWDALVPADWDPFKDFKDLNLQSLDDGDPRANALLKRMREAWDAAPVNAALNGQVVRIPGFVVPLEDSNEGLREFLLVPYFGACIHSPPPPANQILHVLATPPAKGVRSMDTVWVTGKLFTERTDSYMGVSGYKMRVERVEPYTEKAR